MHSLESQNTLSLSPSQMKLMTKLAPLLLVTPSSSLPLGLLLLLLLLVLVLVLVLVLLLLLRLLLSILPFLTLYSLDPPTLQNFCHNKVSVLVLLAVIDNAVYAAGSFIYSFFFVKMQPITWFSFAYPVITSAVLGVLVSLWYVHDVVKVRASCSFCSISLLLLIPLSLLVPLPILFRLAPTLPRCWPTP
jgi:hypothetical protein